MALPRFMIQNLDPRTGIVKAEDCDCALRVTDRSIRFCSDHANKLILGLMGTLFETNADDFIP